MVTSPPIPPDAGPDTFAAAAGSQAAPNPYAAASAQGAATPVRRRARGWRIAAKLLAGLCVLALLLATLGWVWAGRSTSLATTLAQVARWLPAGQSLESRDVSGSLRGGGKMGWLRWSSPSLAVEVTDARIGWSLAPLLQRTVKLGEVQAARVRITSTPQPDTPPTPPLEQLELPVRVDLPFKIDQLEWVGPPAVQAQALAGRYHYDGTQHHLDINSVDLAQGHYSATATLDGRAPMALQARLDGQVSTTAPGSALPLEMSAHASVQGTLATAAARLQMQAQLRPQTLAEAPAIAPPVAQPASAPTGRATRAAPSAATPSAPAMQADASATLMPWAPQPLVEARVQLRALNLAAIWPQAPATQLYGSVQAGPDGEGWRIAAQLRNDLAGPWDLQRLPLTLLDASAQYDGTQWRFPAAQVQSGSGRITLQGSYSPAEHALEGAAQVQNLSPAALHSQLDATPIAGQLRAQSQSDGVHFSADLQAARGRASSSKVQPLRIESMRATGQWQAPLLTLHSVDITALQAQLRGQNIEVTLNDAAAARGTLALTVPGATAHASGQLAPTSGAGELRASVAAAERTQAWLQSLPGLAPALQGVAVQGQVQLKAQWQGGWQSLLQQVQAATGTAPSRPAASATASAAPSSKTTFSLQATLDAPQLAIALPATAKGTVPTHVQLSELHAQLGGYLAQARLSLNGQARVNDHSLRLQTDITGGLGTVSAAATQWRARIAALQLQWKDSQRPGPWTLQLAQPLDLTLQQSHSASARGARHTVQASAGQATLTGPVTGTPQLRWQPLQLEQSVAGALRLQTRGELSGLPMAWVDALAPAGQAPLAELGLAGNLVLDGQWDVNAADTLRASTTLQRASGDVRVLTGEPATVTTVRSSGTNPKAAATVTTQAPGAPAGLRQAVLQLDAEGEQLRARLLWDSERAGHIDASASTRLARQDGGWAWPTDAPVAARVRAHLPDLGLWSALAPPGWRVNGTLDADATLSGSRNTPRWQGSLGADQVTVRSLLDGVDLQDGRLRATLRGERLDITELSLRGGRGSNARIAGYSGNLTPAPSDGGTLTGSGSITWGGTPNSAAGSGIRMDINTQARALQVLVRADRQVSVSGQLSAKLDQGQLTLRGKLTADRATLLLPEASAPQLGSDVVVRSAAIDKANAEKAARAGTAAARAQTAKPPDIAVTFNLGRDFALQGHGITTRLTGELDIRSSPVAGAPPRVTGEVHTEQGRYRAWGQVLDVETGLARFNGPYNNPALDILAIRPNISVRAGVQVTGSAQAPRVRLYADPDLPDAEKLAWVITGHNAAAGGAEAALLQQAALTLLGSRGNNTDGLARGLGLDEIGFKGPESGSNANGAAITLGKRLSSKLYVTYEQSLSGAIGAIYIFYDLSRRLTLRGQTGTQSAVDIIYTVRHD